ncbi:MAG: hypothetical protein ACFFCV_08255 [Promethearchaeota archaeon]
MLERSHSFEIRDKSYDNVQDIMESVLKNNLSLSIDSKRLGSSLIRINYIDNTIEKEQQKDNRITILQEPGKRVYIQINGKLTDPQVDEIWNELEKKLNNSTYMSKTAKHEHKTAEYEHKTVEHEYKTVEHESSKDEIIREIKHLIELRGYIVKDEEVKTFIENFIKEYDRLPKNNEFASIVKGYMIMINEDYLKEKAEMVIENESLSQNKEIELESTKNDIESTSSNSVTNTIVIENSIGRRKCPSCGNEGLIHEMDDKSVILLDYPKIYGKKYVCGQCSYEWRKK